MGIKGLALIGRNFSLLCVYLDLVSLPIGCDELARSTIWGVQFQSRSAKLLVWRKKEVHFGGNKVELHECVTKGFEKTQQHTHGHNAISNRMAVSPHRDLRSCTVS